MSEFNRVIRYVGQTWTLIFIYAIQYIMIGEPSAGWNF